MPSLFKSKVEAGTSEPHARFIKLVLSQAVMMQAIKLVLGEPAETGCKRKPIERQKERVWEAPWENEDRERFSGRSEKSMAEARRAREAHWSQGVPLWLKIGDTYEALLPFPKHLFLPILALMGSWNGLCVPWGDETPYREHATPAVTKAALDALLADRPDLMPDDLAFPNYDRAALSCFLLHLKDGKMVRASLGFESSHCLSIAIDSTQQASDRSPVSLP
jgi:hypothetical protein